MLALLFALAVAAGARAEELDADRYPESSAAAIVKTHPCRPGPDGYDSKDALFSLRAEYRPEVRSQSKERAALLKRWVAKLNVPDQADKFTRELRVGRGAGALWAAITDEMLEAMKKDFKPGDSAWFYLSLIGCVGQEPAFAIDEFQAIDYDDLEDEVTSYIT